MLTSLIDSVGSLWPLALVLTVLVLGLVFRVPIARRLDIGGVHLERGNVKIHIDPATEDADSRTSQADELIEPAQLGAGETETNDVDQIEAGGPAKATWLDVLRLLEDKKSDEARTAFEQVIAEQPEDEKRRSAVTFALWRARRGNDTTAYADLERFSHDEDRRSLALRFMAVLKTDEGLYDDALRLYERSRDSASDATGRLASNRGIAVSLDHLGQTSEAHAYLASALLAATSDEERIAYYDQHAELCQRHKEWLLRAAALEKAQEFAAPGETSRHFNIGYSYTEAGENELALLHYGVALKYKPDDSSTRNNLGVAYDRLDLNIKAAAAYEKSADGGETLAMANLGHKLLSAGFGRQAREILQTAMGHDNPHPNVLKNLDTLHQRESAESDREEALLRGAERDREFFRRYSEARFVASTTAIASGEWEVDGEPARFDVAEETLIVSFKKAAITYRLVGRVIHSAYDFDVEQETTKWAPTAPTTTFEKKGRGQGVVAENRLDVRLETGREPWRETFRRRQPAAA